MNRLPKIILPALILLAGACDSNSGETSAGSSGTLDKEIQNLEARLYDSPETYDRKTATELMNAYVNFHAAAPGDTRAPDRLFKAAEIALQLGEYQKSLAYFREVHDNYPDYRNRPLALFFQGNIYDDNLDNDARAGEIYREFLQKYPDHAFSEDVKILLNNLGKSDAELLREFELRDSVGMGQPNS